MTIVGIDTGNKGGVVALDHDGAIIESHPMRTRAECGKNVTSALWVNRTLTKMHPQWIAVEFLVGGRSAKAAKSMTDGFARVAAAIELLDFPVRLLMPSNREWTGQYWAHGQPDTKARAREEAAKLWDVSRFVQPRCRIPHDGIVDAALIAEWARRKVIEPK